MRGWRRRSSFRWVYRLRGGDFRRSVGSGQPHGHAESESDLLHRSHRRIWGCYRRLFGLLLSRHTFMQVGYRIAFNLHWCSCIGKTCCRLWENSGCVVNKIVTESLFLDFILCEVFRQLIYYCTDHFKMIKFFCAYVGESALEFRQGHCKSLTQISQWRTQLTIRTAVWQNVTYFDWEICWGGRLCGQILFFL